MPEEGTGFSGAGVTGGFEGADMDGGGLNLASLEEYQVFFTAELLFQSRHFYVKHPL